jgi:hypothetical protein
MLYTPWLVLAVTGAIHVLADPTTAGVTLTTGTVAMEPAPLGEAAGISPVCRLCANRPNSAIPSQSERKSGRA